MPKNLKAIVIAFVFVDCTVISVRIDMMMAEWNGKLDFLKIWYFS